MRSQANALASIMLGEQAHIEVAGGYKHRSGDQAIDKDYAVSDVDYQTYVLSNAGFQSG